MVSDLKDEQVARGTGIPIKREDRRREPAGSQASGTFGCLMRTDDKGGGLRPGEKNLAFIQ